MFLKRARSFIIELVINRPKFALYSLFFLKAQTRIFCRAVLHAIYGTVIQRILES